jgi:hypothetical protein
VHFLDSHGAPRLTFSRKRTEHVVGETPTLHDARISARIAPSQVTPPEGTVRIARQRWLVAVVCLTTLVLTLGLVTTTHVVRITDVD